MHSELLRMSCILQSAESTCVKCLSVFETPPVPRTTSTMRKERWYGLSCVFVLLRTLGTLDDIAHSETSVVSPTE